LDELLQDAIELHNCCFQVDDNFCPPGNATCCGCLYAIDCCLGNPRLNLIYNSSCAGFCNSPTGAIANGQATVIFNSKSPTVQHLTRLLWLLFITSPLSDQVTEHSFTHFGKRCAGAFAELFVKWR